MRSDGAVYSNFLPANVVEGTLLAWLAFSFPERSTVVCDSVLILSAPDEPDDDDEACSGVW